MAFPSNDSVLRQPLGSSGSLGLVPRLHGYYGLLRIPALLPTALRFLRLAVPPCARLFAPGRIGTPSSRPGFFGSWLPQPRLLRWKRQGLPGSWGTPCAHALLLDPGGILKPGLCGSRMRPSVIRTTSASAMNTISGLHDTAYALPVYASQSRSPFPTQDSVLAAGQLCQVGLVAHRVPLRGFRSTTSSLPPHPGLAWRTRIRRRPRGRP
jgi:hypothetical protein